MSHQYGTTSSLYHIRWVTHVHSRLSKPRYIKVGGETDSTIQLRKRTIVTLPRRAEEASLSML